MIAHFSLRMIFGISLMWLLMPRSQVTAGFFRIQMLLVMGLSVLAALSVTAQPLVGSLQMTHVTARQIAPLAGTQTVICWLLVAVAFTGSVCWTLGRRSGGTVGIFLIGILSLLTRIVANFGLVSVSDPPLQLRSTDVLIFLSDLSTAAMFGGCMTAMLLGHWYLTAPSMSHEPLKRLNLYYGVAGVLRLLLSTICLYLFWSLIKGNTEWVWLLLRWLAGIVGPLIVAVMVWQIMKYKNTQSATGVLFVGVILTLIGELSAILLTNELRVPF